MMNVYSELYFIILLLFALGSTTIYSLIISRRNYLMVFILTPLLLVSTIYSSNIILALLGSPIKGFPVNETVEIKWVEVADPVIYFVALDTSLSDTRPKYYVVPYTKQNRDTMQELKKRLENGRQTQGEFKIKNKGGSSESKQKDLYEFHPTGLDGPMKTVTVKKKPNIHATPMTFRELQRRRLLSGNTGVHPE